jgi:pSer/pThr/pTyr-binding forkhead associated (FHA) protein
VDTSGTVSRKHARIGKDDSSVFLEDLGSSNGTRLNGQPLREGMQAPLDDGDQIVFGDVVFNFRKVSTG